MGAAVSRDAVVDVALGPCMKIGSVEDDLTTGLISIGEFARRARLTPRALRIYDRTGMLRPVRTDAGTGYRRYGVAQVRIGQLISLLRGAGLGLADIELVLRDVTAGAGLAVDWLADAASNPSKRSWNGRGISAGPGLASLKAISNFDPSFGRSLAAYAQPCTSGEIKRHFRDKSWQIHVSARCRNCS